MPEDWKLLSSKAAFDSAWIRVRQDKVRLPNGLELDDYYVVEQFDFVKVFAITESGLVVFVRQYKHGLGRVILELPAGFVETGEDPAAAAARELREETGYAGNLRKVAEWVVDPTRSATIEHVYFGRVERAGEQCLDATEDIEVVLLPAADIPALIRAGEVMALSSVAATLYCLPLFDEQHQS